VSFTVNICNAAVGGKERPHGCKDVGVPVFRPEEHSFSRLLNSTEKS